VSRAAPFSFIFFLYTFYMSEIEIIPSINAETFTEVKKKIEAVEPYVSWVHIDVADGSFTDIQLWHNPEDLLALQTPLLVEVHLMIADIDERIGEWLRPIVRRVIFHREASRDPDVVIRACRSSDVRVGMAVLPNSSADVVLPYLSKIDLVQTLAVTPGRSGQSFQPDTLQKITALHNACPSCAIEVDGGVNTTTVASIVQSGASLLVAGSAIFSPSDREHIDIKSAIEDLRRHATA